MGILWMNEFEDISAFDFIAPVAQHVLCMWTDVENNSRGAEQCQDHRRVLDYRLIPVSIFQWNVREVLTFFRHAKPRVGCRGLCPLPLGEFGCWPAWGASRM